MKSFAENQFNLVNDCPPKKAKLASADDSGNESDDTSIVAEKCPGKTVLTFFIK